jgi:flagellar hook-associated protein 3 FlgL
MSITGVGSNAAATIAALVKMHNQLDDLSRQLGTGQKAATYSGLQAQAGLTVGLDAQLSAIDGYNNTIATVGTTLTVAQSALTQIASVGALVKQAAGPSGATALTLDNTGQTTAQEAATSQLDQILSLLNTQVGSSYIFSGSASNQASVETTDHILNGNGAQAGFKQVMSERSQADLGANGLGRLVIPAAAGTAVSISEDVAGSPFGFKLAGVTSTLTGATVTGPSGSPKTISVNLASNPNSGDTIQFNLNLPDGTSTTLSLQATTSATPGPNQFTIGATAAATATNLQAALTTAVGTLAQTTLRPASAVAAANNFFKSTPPQRVAGPPFATATALQNGTSANTVSWYTGENGSTPARQTALALIGPSTSIAYGMRANEQALSTLVANVAVFAATTNSPSDVNAAASYAGLTQRVVTNMSAQQGVQQVSNIEADLANAQVAANDAKSANSQTQNTLSGMLQNIEGVSQDQVGAELLALQTTLQASLSTTARMAEISLVNYLK